MSATLQPDASPTSPSGPAPGLWQRALLIFTRPTRAWGGLREHAQWWFPMALLALVTSATMLAVYERSYLPMMTEGIERQVADGQMSQEQLERTEAFFAGPAGKGINVGFQFLGVVLITLFAGLLYWLGGGFILGRPFGYRLGLEVAAWSGLVTLPGFLLHNLLAYLQGLTVREVHVGFGVLLQGPDPPSKLTTALMVFLDGMGPLAVWSIVVGILGLAALSGAPRKSCAWVMGSLYVALQALAAVLAGLFSHGA
jgi:hypothetical protein